MAREIGPGGSAHWWRTQPAPPPDYEYVPRGQEQARYAWQWGPPYTFPGNPPIAQELLTAYPNYTPEFEREMRSVPIYLGDSAIEYGGWFTPGPNDITLVGAAADEPRVQAHEFAHAYDLGQGPFTKLGGVSGPSSDVPILGRLSPWQRALSKIPGLSKNLSDAYSLATSARPWEQYAELGERGGRGIPTSLRPFYAGLYDFGKIDEADMRNAAKAWQPSIRAAEAGQQADDYTRWQIRQELFNPPHWVMSALQQPTSDWYYARQQGYPDQQARLDAARASLSQMPPSASLDSPIFDIIQNPEKYRNR